jgi:hypothetical protein
MRTGLALLLAAAGLSSSAYGGAQAVGTAPDYADGYYAGTPYLDQSACWANGWGGNFDYPYCGWYDGFFYPGSGTYVYDRGRHPHVWTPGQQNHWASRGPRPSNGMHNPGPVAVPGGQGFAPAPARIGPGIGGMRGGGHGFGGVGFGGGHGAGGGHGSGGGHSGR